MSYLVFSVLVVCAGHAAGSEAYFVSPQRQLAWSASELALSRIQTRDGEIFVDAVVSTKNATVSVQSRAEIAERTRDREGGRKQWRHFLESGGEALDTTVPLEEATIAVQELYHAPGLRAQVLQLLTEVNVAPRDSKANWDFIKTVRATYLKEESLERLRARSRPNVGAVRSVAELIVKCERIRDGVDGDPVEFWRDQGATVNAPPTIIRFRRPGTRPTSIPLSWDDYYSKDELETLREAWLQASASFLTVIEDARRKEVK